MSTEREKIDKIKQILLEHVGKDKAIKSKVIALRIGVKEDDTHIKTRTLITELVKQGLPIGACGNGYFIMVTQKEVDDYQQILNNRIDEIWERKRFIQNSFDTYYGNSNPVIKKEREEDEDQDIL
jgi:hypothetical protein